MIIKIRKIVADLTKKCNNKYFEITLRHRDRIEFLNETCKLGLRFLKHHIKNEKNKKF